MKCDDTDYHITHFQNVIRTTHHIQRIYLNQNLKAFTPICFGVLLQSQNLRKILPIPTSFLLLCFNNDYGWKLLKHEMWQFNNTASWSMCRAPSSCRAFYVDQCKVIGFERQPCPSAKRHLERWYTSSGPLMGLNPGLFYPGTSWRAERCGSLKDQTLALRLSFSAQISGMSIYF
jgi:hypothetical protein